MKKYILSFIILLLAGVNAAWAQNVAQIGTTPYATLEAAIEAATTGQTITLLANVNTASQIEVGKKVTLDLNGKTIAYTGTTTLTSGVIRVLRGGDLTVTDGSGNNSGNTTIINIGNISFKPRTFCIKSVD